MNVWNNIDNHIKLMGHKIPSNLLCIDVGFGHFHQSILVSNHKVQNMTSICGNDNSSTLYKYTNYLPFGAPLYNITHGSYRYNAQHVERYIL